MGFVKYMNLLRSGKRKEGFEEEVETQKKELQDALKSLGQGESKKKSKKKAKKAKKG